MNGDEMLLDYAAFLEHFNITSVVRIPSAEFDQINLQNPSFDHFNLGKTHHQVGERYLVLKIVRHGSLTAGGTKEVPPLLSLDRAFIVECEKVENNVSYADLTPEHFTYALPTTPDLETLRPTIHNRYKTSRPDLTGEEMEKLGVGYTRFKIIETVDGASLRKEVRELPSPVVISEQDGYVPVQTEGVSSKVFLKDGKIYKLNIRLSVERQTSDLYTLKEHFSEFAQHIPDSEVHTFLYDGVAYTGVVQPLIVGKELKKLPREVVEVALRNNKEFVEALLQYFFSAIEKRELYPDIVGFPADPDFFNSVNLMLEEETGRIVLCDVNLSPHEDTLQKHGKAFYDGENVTAYVAKMKTFKGILEKL